MGDRRFTIVCEFRGGTYVSQLAADDERDAARRWAEYLKRERPIPRVSSYLAKSVAEELVGYPPVPFDGLSGVWCVTGNCGGNLMLANIIESPSAGNRH